MKSLSASVTAIAFLFGAKSQKDNLKKDSVIHLSGMLVYAL